MSEQKRERPASDTESHALFERQLDERWETVSPGIYRLREDSPPGPTRGEPTESIEWVLQELVTGAIDERAEPKKKRRGSKHPKQKHGG